MKKIKEKQELIMENVLSLRNKMTQNQVQEHMTKIGQTMKELEVTPNNHVVTITYSVENAEQGQVMDVEILVPLNRLVKLPSEYKFKPVFKLVNAVYIRHEGRIAEFENSVNRLVKYINENNL